MAAGGNQDYVIRNGVKSAEEAGTRNETYKDFRGLRKAGTGRGGNPAGFE